MATLIASVNHYVTASSKASVDVFASIFELLDLYGDQIGVRRIAYNTGSYPQSKGMGYSHDLDETSNNAWACFYFYRADNPFFAVLQFATSSTPSFPFGDDLQGSQGVLGGNDPYARLGGVGIQFAAVPFRLGRDVDVWAGSRRSDGNDKKNFPCPWSTQSNDLVVFPRANNGLLHGFPPSGISPLTKSAYTMLVSQRDLATSSVMWHIIADSNNFVFVKTFGSSSSSYAYSGLYFGQYSEAVGFNSKLKYVLFNHVTSSGDPPFSPLSSGTWYGDRQGTSSLDGGLAHPACQSGCFAVCLDYPTFITSSRFSPARLFATTSKAPLYDEFPWAVGAYDPEGQVFGFAGSVEFMRVMWGVPTHTFFSSSFRAAFGNSISASVKLTIPWPSGSGVLPGTNLNRTGTLSIFDSTY